MRTEASAAPDDCRKLTRKNTSRSTKERHKSHKRPEGQTQNPPNKTQTQRHHQTRLKPRHHLPAKDWKPRTDSKPHDISQTVQQSVSCLHLQHNELYDLECQRVNQKEKRRSLKERKVDLVLLITSSSSPLYPNPMISLQVQTACASFSMILFLLTTSLEDKEAENASAATADLYTAHFCLLFLPLLLKELTFVNPRISSIVFSLSSLWLHWWQQGRGPWA